MPKTLYRLMLWLVRDYDRLKDGWENILHESPTQDGQPRKTGTNDPTASKAARREKLGLQHNPAAVVVSRKQSRRSRRKLEKKIEETYANTYSEAVGWIDSRTIESVPECYSEAVIAQLASIGLDANGNPIG